MTFLKHIPGVRRDDGGDKAPVQKRVGVVGLHEGRTLVIGSDRCRHARVVAACDLSEEKIATTRAERPDIAFTTDYAALLAMADVDIVAIYTPDALHGTHITAAFDAGKDVICTKPLVNSIADARTVLAAARRTGRKLLVGQSTRFFEPFQRQRRSFDAGEYGALELVDAHYIHRMDWFYDKSPWAVTDTDWIFLGMSHPIDLVRWYLGPIVQVQALGGRSALGTSYGLSTFDIYTANLVAADGRIGRAMGHYGCHELPTARNCIELMLYGSRRSGLAQYHDMRYVHSSPDGTEVTEDPLYALRHRYFNSEVHGMHYGEFANYLDHFARALIDGTPWSPTLEEGLETFCVMEAVRRSALTRQPVDVRPLLAEIGLVPGAPESAP